MCFFDDGHRPQLYIILNSLYGYIIVDLYSVLYTCTCSIPSLRVGTIPENLTATVTARVEHMCF